MVVMAVCDIDIIWCSCKYRLEVLLQPEWNYNPLQDDVSTQHDTGLAFCVHGLLIHMYMLHITYTYSLSTILGCTAGGEPGHSRGAGNAEFQGSWHSSLNRLTEEALHQEHRSVNLIDQHV